MDLENITSNVTFWEPLSFVLGKKLIDSPDVGSQLEFIELYDLYVSIRCQLDLIRMSSTMTLEDYETGKRIVEQQFQRAVEYVERLVILNYWNRKRATGLGTGNYLVDTLIRQLHPSQWKRIKVEQLIQEDTVIRSHNATTPRQSDIEQTDSKQNIAVVDRQYGHRPSDDSVNLFYNSFYLMNILHGRVVSVNSIMRFSYVLSTTYLANFHYTAR